MTAEPATVSSTDGSRATFPGGVADLTWDLTVVDGRIQRLIIAP